MAGSQETATPVNPWPLTSWIGATALVIVAGAIGFVVMGASQQDAATPDLWSAICRAVGIPVRGGAKTTGKGEAHAPTNIAWSRTTLDKIGAGDPVRGAFVARNCLACHEGTQANMALVVPRLSGMEAAVIFKQLDDYRSGKRVWGVMGAIAKALTPQDAANVAAHYASRSNSLRPDSGVRVPTGGRGLQQPDAALRLVFAGDPARGIAPCSACHGPGGYKAGAPALSGQHAGYIERQLAAFAQGARRNDIAEQMRVVARRLTPEERRGLAAFYGGQTARPARIASGER